MSVGWCKACGGATFSWEVHRCPPRYEFRLVGWGDDLWRDVYAHDEESAAEKACEDYDDNGGEYGIIRAGGVTVDIRREGVVTRFHVEAESRPHYSASLSSEEPPPEETDAAGEGGSATLHAPKAPDREPAGGAE